MKRKTIIGIALGVLLIGIVSAGLVPWLSNMVSGEVTVEGPVLRVLCFMPVQNI